MADKQLKLDDTKKIEIGQYLTTLRNIETQNRADLDTNIDEYWSRHFGTYSAKKNKNFPWSGSADIQTGIVQYSDSAIEGRFCNGINSLKFLSIVSRTSKVSADSAKNVENFFNNYWYHKTGVKKVILDFFQYTVVEGTGFLKIVPKKKNKKVKKYKFMEMFSNLKDKVLQPILGQDGQMQTEEKERDEFVGAVWENVKTNSIGFERAEGSLKNAGYVFNRFKLSPLQIWEKKEKSGWYNVDDILLKGVANPVPIVEADANQDKQNSEQTKNDYQGFDNTVSMKKIFYEWWMSYNMGTAEKPDYRYMMFVQSHDTGKLVYHEENAFFDTRKPYVSAPCWRVAGRIVGQGMPQRIGVLNDTIDTLFNQALDNNTRANTVCGVMVSQPGVDIEKFTGAPGQYMPVKSLDMIKNFDFPNRLGDINALLQAIMSLIERKSIVNDESMGRNTQQNRRNTARGTSMILQQYALNLDLLMQNIQEALREAVYQTMQCLYEFMPNEGIKYSYKNPKAGQEINPGQSQAIEPEFVEGTLKREDLEYIDDWDIGILQGVVDVMVNAEKQSATMILQAFGNDQTGEIDNFFVKKWFSEVMAPRQAKEIMRTPKETQMIKMVQQQAQVLQQKEKMIAMQSQKLDTALQQHQQRMIGEKAELEEAKFLHELEKAGVPDIEKVHRLEAFRQHYIAREKARSMGLNPDEAVKIPQGQPQGQPQPPQAGQ